MQIYYLKEFTLIGIEFEKSTKKHAHLGKKKNRWLALLRPVGWAPSPVTRRLPAR